MKFLFIFLDGVGLGVKNPSKNPFARSHTPNLKALLDGRILTRSSAPYQNGRATLLALDACLGIEGLPQSATGQGTLITGINIPKEIGYHYGPKPNPEVADVIKESNVFAVLDSKNYRATLLNAYPPRYFESIESGKRLYSAIPLAVTNAGIPLKTAEDLFAGEALSADFTGHGWRDQLGFPETPVLSPYEAGERLAQLAMDYDFSFYEVWLTDYAGHMQDMEGACRIVENFDQVLSGLLDQWDDRQGLVFLTSDHGNMEDVSTRHHTDNPVPGLAIGSPDLRDRFCSQLGDLAGVMPAILRMFP
jgi:2,3-bisphosphoglycerate-independent phosphoglycerate mutase